MKLLTSVEASAAEAANLADFYHAQPTTRLLIAVIDNFSRIEAQALYEKLKTHVPMLARKMKDTAHVAQSSEKNSAFIAVEHNGEFGILAWQDNNLQLFVTEKSGTAHLPNFYEQLCSYVKEL